MRLIIWGAGEHFSKFGSKMAGHEIRLVDADPGKQGVYVGKNKVENPQILREAAYDYVVIGSYKYYDEIKQDLIGTYHVAEEKIFSISDDLDVEILMRKIGHSHSHNKKNGIKILFGYCFSVYTHCAYHDFLLAESLKRRGAEIIPVICGGLQEVECSVYGGLFGNDAPNVCIKKKNHVRNCKICMEHDNKIWKCWGDYDILVAKNELSDTEKQNVKYQIDSLDINDYKHWEYDGYPIGHWAALTYFNVNGISDKKEFNAEEEKIFRYLAYNVILMYIASKRIIERTCPDIIYANDSFYYPWSTLETLAKEKGIPFYNGTGYSIDTYSYAKDAPTLDMPLESAWKTFGERNMTEEERKFIEWYIQNRRYGKNMIVNTADPKECITTFRKEAVQGRIDLTKKTAILASNASWDAVALNKDMVFENMFDWIVNTVRFFENNSQWQLIIRAHPTELATKFFPEARERVCPMILEMYNYQLPDNIILVDADAKFSIYDLLSFADLGLVYTTTVGLEMSCVGIPVITVAKAPYWGKGFTYDPMDTESYYKLISELLLLDTYGEKERRMIQARKYLFLYHFVYMMHNPFLKFYYDKGIEVLLKDASELEEGRNPMWDYVCDSIMNGKELLSNDRFPPYEVPNKW